MTEQKYWCEEHDSGCYDNVCPECGVGETLPRYESRSSYAGGRMEQEKGGDWIHMDDVGPLLVELAKLRKERDNDAQKQ